MGTLDRSLAADKFDDTPGPFARSRDDRTEGVFDVSGVLGISNDRPRDLCDVEGAKVRQTPPDPLLAIDRIADEVRDLREMILPSGRAKNPVPDTVRQSPSRCNGIRGVRSPGGVTAHSIRTLIRHRKLRYRFFSADWFADPAWDILLNLTAAKLEQCPVSTSSLCLACNVPQTTALRWVKNMTDAGLLVRERDPDDARRVFVSLGPDAEALMVAYFEQLGSMDAQDGSLTR